MSRGTRRNRRKAQQLRSRVGALTHECPRCGKRFYRMQAAALDAVAATRGAAGGRVYESCGGWHLTSRRKRFASPDLPARRAS